MSVAEVQKAQEALNSPDGTLDAAEIWAIQSLTWADLNSVRSAVEWSTINGKSVKAVALSLENVAQWKALSPENVAKIQILTWALPIDGKFGNGTLAKVKEYQEKNRPLSPEQQNLKSNLLALKKKLNGIPWRESVARGSKFINAKFNQVAKLFRGEFSSLDPKALLSQCRSLQATVNSPYMPGIVNWSTAEFGTRDEQSLQNIGALMVEADTNYTNFNAEKAPFINNLLSDGNNQTALLNQLKGSLKSGYGSALNRKASDSSINTKISRKQNNGSMGFTIQWFQPGFWLVSPKAVVIDFTVEPKDLSSIDYNKKSQSYINAIAAAAKKSTWTYQS